MRLCLQSTSDEETRQIGEQIGQSLSAGDVVALVGCLGAGKTCFTQGIARGLGIAEEEVVSPTYILIREISGSIPLIHIDLYRISDTDDLENTGFYDAFDDASVTVIEWADRFPGEIPEEHLRIRLERIDDMVRDLTFEPHGKKYREMVKSLTQKSAR